MKNMFVILLVIFVLLCMLTGLFSCMGLLPSSEGDGKISCKNCGKSSVYAIGYCKRCYESFIEFTYGD